MRKTIKIIITGKGDRLKILKFIINFFAVCILVILISAQIFIRSDRIIETLFYVILSYGVLCITVYFLIKIFLLLKKIYRKRKNQYEKPSLRKESEELSGNDDAEKEQGQIIEETNKIEYEEQKSHIISEIGFKGNYVEKPKELPDNNSREEIPFNKSVFDEGSVTNGIFLNREIMDQFPSRKYFVLLSNYSEIFDSESKTLTIHYRIAKLIYCHEQEYWNSHGTGRNIEKYEYKVTVENAVQLLNENKPKGYDTEIQRLEILGTILDQLKDQAGQIFTRYFPDVCSFSILHVSERSTVFLVKDKKEHSTVIKAEMMCHGAVEDLKPLLDYLNASDYSGNLMPVLEYAVIPSDPDTDILLIRMPYLSTERSGRISGTDASKYILFDSWTHAYDSAAALAELSSLGYVHLDVKPENIFYSYEDGRCKVILGDINSVRKPESQYAYTVHCTSGLMSPELRMHEPYSFSTDVFSWGMTLLRIFVKKDLDMDEIERITLEEITQYGNKHQYRLSVKQRNTDDIFSINESRPKKEFPKLWNVVLNALKEDPADRIKDGSNLLDELESILLDP